MSSTPPAPIALVNAQLVARWAGLVFMFLAALGLALAAPFVTYLQQNYDSLPKFVADRFFFDLYEIDDYREVMFLWAAWPAALFLILGGALLAVTVLPLRNQYFLFVKRVEIGIWGLVLLGVLFRFRAFLEGRSLWLDEAFLAVNIRDSGLAKLFSEDLAFGQSAPPGFLFVVWISSQVFGMSELSLRLIPFLFGCGLVILAAPVSRLMFVSNRGRLSFVAFIAFSPVLIYYSNELKQYSVDAFVTMLVLWMWFNRENQRSRWLFGWLGLLAVLFSLTAVFSLTALGAALFFVALGGKFERASLENALRATGKTYVLWIFGGLIHAAYLIQAGPNRGSMDSWWRENGGFPPFEGFLSNVVWVQESLAQLVWLAYLHPGRAGPGMGDGIFLLVAAVGVVMILGFFARSSGTKLALLFVTVGQLAAFASIYPFSSRLNIYLVPIVAMLFALGVEYIGRFRAAKLRKVLTGLLVATHVLPLTVALLYWAKPLDNWDMRWLVAEVSTRSAEGDAVFSPDEPIFDWYHEGIEGLEVLVPHDFVRPEKINSFKSIWLISTLSGFGFASELNETHHLACEYSINGTFLNLWVSDASRLLDDDICRPSVPNY